MGPCRFAALSGPPPVPAVTRCREPLRPSGIPHRQSACPPSPVPSSPNWGQGTSGDRELGAANWEQGTGDRELGTGNWDRQLGRTGNWDRELGAGDLHRGLKGGLSPFKGGLKGGLRGA